MVKKQKFRVAKIKKRVKNGTYLDPGVAKMSG